MEYKLSGEWLLKEAVGHVLIFIQLTSMLPFKLWARHRS